MTKKEFLESLRESRNFNVASTSLGKLKKSYSKQDDELAWRLFQVFPGDWTDEERFRGLCLLIIHMSVYSLALFKQGQSCETIAKSLHQNLKEELFFHIGYKHLLVFAKTVKRTVLFNK